RSPRVNKRQRSIDGASTEIVMAKKQRLPRPASRWYRPTVEALEDRVLLTVADQIFSSIAPYQAALTQAINTAASLAIIGEQFRSLQEFNTILQNSLTNIESQVQNWDNGPVVMHVSLPSISHTFRFDLGLDSFLEFETRGDVSATFTPKLNIGFNYQDGDVQ